MKYTQGHIYFEIQIQTTITTKKSAYRGGFEKLKTASIDYQTASIDMNAL